MVERLDEPGTPLLELTQNEYLRLLSAARVSEEKGSLRCLRKLYRATRADIERSIALLVEQAQVRLLEEEQLATGWSK